MARVDRGQGLQIDQFLYVRRLKKYFLRGIVPCRVFANLAGQITRRIHSRIEQHSRAAQLPGQNSRIKPTK